jgi:hypothetical protein
MVLQSKTDLPPPTAKNTRAAWGEKIKTWKKNPRSNRLIMYWLSNVKPVWREKIKKKFPGRRGLYFVLSGEQVGESGRFRDFLEKNGEN